VSPASLQQDADIVAFIDRDDTYHLDSSEKGVAEVIVAKHRNGPAGKIRLAFAEHLPRFAELAGR
jgi:replicative DNA helicase